MYMRMYVAEPENTKDWQIIDESSFTGHSTGIDKLEEREARLYAKMMNEVYNRIKEDIEDGFIKCG